jgi:hypothetical protein
VAELVGGAQHHVETGRVLGEQNAQLTVVQPQPFEAAEARAEAGHGACDGGGVDPQAAGGGVGRDQVVGVVDAAHHRVQPRPVAELEALAVEPRGGDAPDRHRGLGAREVAGGAPVCATVGQNDAVEVQRGTAARAAAGVGGVGDAVEELVVGVDADVHHPR